jgi:hypothetical protein
MIHWQGMKMSFIEKIQKTPYNFSFLTLSATSSKWHLYLLTYLLMWHYNQYLVKTCWKRSLHDCLPWAQCVQSLTPRARLSLFTPSAHLDFGLPWFLLPKGLALNRLFVVSLWVFWSCDQRSAICLSSWHLGHSGCQTLSRVRGCTFSCRHHFWFSGRISFKEPSSQIQAIGSPPFWSTPTSHCRRAGLGRSRSCEWWILSGVKGGLTPDVC